MLGLYCVGALAAEALDPRAAASANTHQPLEDPMKTHPIHRSFGIAILSLGTLLGLATAFAAGPTPGLKSTGSLACDKWNSKELRCLVDSRKAGQTTRVIIKNKASATVSLKWNEFHSVCGFSSIGPINTRDLELQPNQEIEAWVQAPGTGITCREVFLAGCASSTAGGCPDLLTAQWESFIGNRQ
jgi:hypothetical protein